MWYHGVGILDLSILILLDAYGDFMICTFFGHKDTPMEIESILRKALIYLIENKKVDLFYVGNQGNFDSIVLKTLKLLQLNYPFIDYAVVLAYMPDSKKQADYPENIHTVYPEGFEKIPPKYAINKQNEWMLNHSDYVVTYVRYTTGGAFKFKEIAEKKSKKVLNLADFDEINKFK